MKSHSHIHYIPFGYILVLFFFITDINWIIFPISTRKLIGLIGLCYFIIKGLYGKSDVLVNGIILYLGSIFILFISFILNNSFDKPVISMYIGRLLSVLGAYYIYMTWKHINLSLYLKIFISIVLFNDITALIFFLIPALSSFFLFLEPASEMTLETYAGLRFIGLGAFRFFEGGVINGLAIISTLYLLITKRISGNITLIILLALLFMGTFIARTSLIGLLGFLFLLYPSSKIKSSLFKIILILISTAVALFICLNILFKDNDALNWAFELVYRYLDDGSIETTSTNGLMDMYKFPDTIRGWLIGDGRWMNFDEGYYMNTDVGFCRMIFLFGLIGTGYFFIYFFYIISTSTKHKTLLEKYFAYIIYIFLLVINLKGFSDFSYYLFPMLFYISARQSRSNVKSKNRLLAANIKDQL